MPDILLVATGETNDDRAVSLMRRTRSSRLEFLDGVRAFAAVWVVLSHIWITWNGIRANDGLLGILTNWLLYSHFAVDIFIVLSGFCLTLPRLKFNPNDGSGALTFFKRRVWRILPPYYCALAVAIIVHAVLSAGGRTGINMRDVAQNIFLLQDIAPASNHFDSPLWSVAVEWRIYFLFPVLWFVINARGAVACLTMSALLACLLTFTVLHWAPQAFMSSPWYVFLFTCGMASAMWASHGTHLRRERLSWGIVVLFGTLGLGITSFHPVTAFGGSDFGIYMPIIDVCLGIATSAFLAALTGQSIVSVNIVRLLSQDPIVYLGTISYSIYLVHSIVLSICWRIVHSLPKYLVGGDEQMLARFVLLSIGTVFVASVSFYRAIESKSIDRSRMVIR